MSLKHAILGLLDRSPRTGYEIKIFFRDAVKNFWSVSDGQLYPTLRSLAEEGWVVKAETVQDGGLTKHVYAITDAGRAAFMEWLRTPERSIPELKEPFLLKLIFFDRLSKEDALHQIEVQIRRTDDALEEYREIRSAHAGTSSFQRTMSDLGLIILEARRLFLVALKDMTARGQLSRLEPLFSDETIDLVKELFLQVIESVASWPAEPDDELAGDLTPRDEMNRRLQQLLVFTRGGSS